MLEEDRWWSWFRNHQRDIDESEISFLAHCKRVNDVVERQVIRRVRLEAWVIRSTRGKMVCYFMSHKCWSPQITNATIFRDYDAACHEMYRARFDVGLVAADELLDVCPFPSERRVS